MSKKKLEPPTPLTKEEEEILNNADLEGVEFEETNTSATTEQEIIPEMSDPGWHDYVMGKFMRDEVDDAGNPYVHGLRRVARLLLGPIVYSGSRTIQAPNVATVVPGTKNQLSILTVSTQEYVLRIHWRQEGLPEGTIVEFVDVADVYTGNTDPEFARHGSAMASTRAEGRCLRKALQLKRVMASEEASSVPLDFSDGSITGTQISFIDVMCQSANINVLKLLNSGKKQYKTIEEVPFDTAVKIAEHLSGLRNKPESIPDKIKGYVPSWRDAK